MMLLAVLAAVPLVAAQIPGIPSCANACASLTTGSAIAPCETGSGGLQLACACGNVGFVNSVASCAASLCPADQLTSAYSQVSIICSGLGVPFTVPVTIDASSTTIVVQGPGAETATGSGSGSMTAAPATMTTSGSGSAAATGSSGSGSTASASASASKSATTNAGSAAFGAPGALAWAGVGAAGMLFWN